MNACLLGANDQELMCRQIGHTSKSITPILIVALDARLLAILRPGALLCKLRGIDADSRRMLLCRVDALIHVAFALPSNAFLKQMTHTYMVDGCCP